MIKISDETKKIYQRDTIPGPITLLVGDQLYPSDDLYPSDNLYPKGAQFDDGAWVQGSLSITESLCSQDTLDYKSVEANALEVELANEGGVQKDLKGQTVEVYQTVNDENIPLGTFTVSETSFDGDYYTKIKAYDDMKKFMGADITDWWNTQVSFPITLRDLLIALCKKVDVAQNVPESWCNSNLVINKGVIVENLTASDLLGMIQEISGAFFHTDRHNVLVLIDQTAEVTTIDHTAIYEDPEIADYEVPAITGVQIKASDNDAGTLYGDKSNVYVINSNYLVYDGTAEQNSAIAKNILDQIGNKSYRPFSAKVKARNYMEIGDPIKITTIKGVTSQFFLLSRKMTDDYLITDEIDVKGKADTVNNPRSNRKTLQELNHRVHEVVEDLDGFKSTYESDITKINGDIENTRSEITQTAEEIKTTVSKTYTTKEETQQVYSAIDQKADSITQSVSKTYTTKDEFGNTLTSYTKKAEIITAINNDTSSVKISADKLNLVFGETEGQQIFLKGVNTNNAYGDGVELFGNGQVQIDSSRRIGLWNYWDDAHKNRACNIVLNQENMWIQGFKKQSNPAGEDADQPSNTIRLYTTDVCQLYLQNYDKIGNFIANDLCLESRGKANYALIRNITTANKLANEIQMTSEGDNAGTYIASYDKNGSVGGSLDLASDMTTLGCGSYKSDANMTITKSQISLMSGVPASTMSMVISKSVIELQNGKSTALRVTDTGKVIESNGINFGTTVISAGVQGGDGEHPITFGWSGSQLICWVDSNQVWSTSDARKKKNIRAIDDDYLEAIGEVELKEFNYNSEPYDTNVLHFGIVAQNIILHLKKHNLSPDKLGVIDRVGNPGLYEDELAWTYTVDKQEFLIARTAYDEKRITNLEKVVDTLTQEVNIQA